ncbi:MAG: MYXO-CTERM sorting domain-containing protein, partial [Deltaproteobacteria bacterium]
DSDGYQDAACGGDDCDDSNADINPGAAESCDDGVDNDCDGDTDLDDADCAACEDSDGDGYQDAACGGSDCDDSNELINPAAEEDCTDGADNDCDGLTDFDDSEQCGRASSGCGCASSRGGSGALALLGLAGLLLLRPRRRRS